MHAMDLMHEADREAGRRNLERLLAGDLLNAEPCGLVSKSGERIPVEVSGVPEFRDGRVIGARVVLRDLRETA